MENRNQKKLLSILRLIMATVIYSLFGWVYFIAYVSPTFQGTLDILYKGIGSAMFAHMYIILIPSYVNKSISEIRYSGAIVSGASIILMIFLLIVTRSFIFS